MVNSTVPEPEWKLLVMGHQAPFLSRPLARRTTAWTCHGITLHGQEVILNAYLGINAGQHFELPALHFQAGCRGPWSAKSEHRHSLAWPRAEEASEWHIESDGSLKLSVGVGHPVEHKSPPGAEAKSWTCCCPCCSIDVHCSVWKTSQSRPLRWMWAEPTLSESVTLLTFWCTGI